MTGKGKIRAGEGAIAKIQGRGTMRLHPLKNFEIQKYYQYEPNGEPSLVIFIQEIIYLKYRMGHMW